MTNADAGVGGRLAWPDVAKGIGIVLMYFGHVLACLPAIEAERGAGPGLEEMRFIYAFHMPLFFLLAGLFFRPAALPSARRRELAWRRLVPVLFFSLLLLPLWLLGPLRHGGQAWHELAPLFADYLRGHPSFDWVTWFLVCLFVCECAALAVLPRLRSATTQCVAGLLFVALGVTACNHAAQTAALIGVEVRAWFLYEACVALGFYMIGHGLSSALTWLSTQRVAALAVGAAGFALAAITYRDNTPLAGLPVMMSAGRHGDPLMFALTALSGSAGVIGFAMAVGDVAWLSRLGRHSLALLGLSGLFFHFVNPRLEILWPPSESALPLTLYTLAVAALSLLAALPVAEALMRWVPQFIGQGRAAAPARPATASISAGAP